MMPTAAIASPPVVWVLMGNKAGDNTQVLALAEALGGPFEVKQLAYKKFEYVHHALFGATIAGVDADRSAHLGAPWPDLVLSAGRRNEPIARWIKQAAGPHPVRIVHVGRPWSPLHHFDLIVTTPQYRLPNRPNVVQNKTPLHRVTAERLRSESDLWRPRLADLPRPFTTVVIGGSSGPYSFDHAAAARLARQANALAAEKGGSLLVTTSARTPADTMETFEAHVTVPHHVFRWSKDATENPYFAFLGLADDIVVTGDSMSMLTEACWTRKPVHIFDLGEGRNAMRPEVRRAAEIADGRSWMLEPTHLRAFLYRLLMRFGPERLSRDIRIIHQNLVADGRAVWLGDPFPEDVALPPMRCLDRAVSGVRRVLGQPGTVAVMPTDRADANSMSWSTSIPAHRSAA
jgi:hypothetical protein